MKPKAIILINDEIENINPNILGLLLKPLFTIDSTVNFSFKSKVLYDYLEYMDNLILDEKIIGVNVSHIYLRGIFDRKALGAGNLRSIWVYLPSTTDFEQTRIFREMRFSQFQFRLVRNVLHHEIIEHFLIMSDKGRRRATRRLRYQFLQRYINNPKTMRKDYFKNLIWFKDPSYIHPNPSKHQVLAALHPRNSSCVAAADVNLDFYGYLNYYTLKTGICDKCRGRLSEGIKAFLNK